MIDSSPTTQNFSAVSLWLVYKERVIKVHVYNNYSESQQRTILFYSPSALAIFLPPSPFPSFPPPPAPDVGQCEVMYGYTAQQDDELTISPGDKVNIIEKYDEDWWQGELNGQVGIFPASYVQDS